MDLSRYLSRQQHLVDSALEEILGSAEDTDTTLSSTIGYAIFPGGKRIRPILTLAAAEAVGSVDKNIVRPACAVELVHCYSLVHDDLPAMDNDDVRRGKPTVHKIAGEGVAILVGDALLTLAFEVIAETEGVPPQTRIQLIKELARASGKGGMIAGQVADLESEGKQIDADTLRYIHRHKTAALIIAALRIGVIAGQCAPDQLAAITGYGEALGLLFQIVDDILDVTGDGRQLGKQIGADQKHHKATYPAIMGLDQSRQIAQQLARDAETAIAAFDHKAEPLRKIISLVLNRQK